MVIDFDTSALPKGAVGLQKLLAAIEAALPGDENQWIEFKAGVDPSTVEGRFTVAKAVVAFANRDPLTAAKWLGGHALIVIGLEPGNIVGTPDIDPATLHSKVNALLAPPAPVWDATPATYKGKHVLVITVDPPRHGDPIAVIGKSSGGAEDGHVYVRNIGKSDRAKSADIRRLSVRVLSAGRAIDGITISPVEGSRIAAVEYPRSWLEDWIEAEEHRLLAPLSPEPTRSMTPAERRMAGLTDRAIADIVKRAEAAQKLRSVMGEVTHQEKRSEAEFRDEVTAYLAECQKGLAKALNGFRQTAAYEVSLEITNSTDTNYEKVLVGLRVGSGVYGYKRMGDFSQLADYLPKAPQKWGPRTENRLFGGVESSAYSYLSSISPTIAPVTPRRPSPTISNGDSLEVKCVPVHLYPKSTADLLTFWLVGDSPLGEAVRVTWTATASNIDGRLDGSFTIPVAADSIDLSEALRHTDVHDE